MPSPTFKVAALFAGIAGVELGFQRALGHDVETAMFCEWWGPAKQVLSTRFAGVDLHPDVRELRDLPADVNVVTDDPAPADRGPRRRSTRGRSPASPRRPRCLA